MTTHTMQRIACGLIAAAGAAMFAFPQYAHIIGGVQSVIAAGAMAAGVSSEQAGDAKGAK
jgi:hypothetical protein